MPARGRLCFPTTLHEIFLFGRPELCRFIRIDADKQNLKSASRFRLEILKAFHEPIQRQVAEHRAIVITEHEDDRLAGEKISERMLGAGFVLKNGVEGNRSPL